MYILRVEYRSGQRIDFGFTDRDVAVEMQNALDDAKDGMVEVLDDHGHVGHMRVEGILATVLVDVTTEAAGQQFVRALIASILEPAAAAGAITANGSGRRPSSVPFAG